MSGEKNERQRGPWWRRLKRLVLRRTDGPWWRRLKRLILLGIVGLVVAGLPWSWTEISAQGHEYDEASAPAADVVIVLGTAVADDRQQPGDRLTGRLETAAALVHAGRARMILVSGDGGGDSGDEPSTMTSYLTGQLGIDPQREAVRDYLACSKAAWDAVRGRPSAVSSPRNPVLIEKPGG